MGKLSEVEIAMIGAHSHNWPSPETSLHWAALHGVVKKAQQVTRSSDNDISAIESDGDLSAEGKRRRATEIAASAIEQLQGDGQLAKAEEAVGRWLQRLDEKIGIPSAPPGNVTETMLAAEIRAHVASQKDRESFLEKHKEDQLIVQAVLGGPAFLSGLTEELKNFFLQRAALARSPKEMAQKEQLSKALGTARQSIEQAARKIAERAQLRRASNGWEPKS